MVKQAWQDIVAFYKDDSGDILQTGIIMAIMAVIAVGALVFLGPKIRENFNKTGNELNRSKGYDYNNPGGGYGY